MIVSFSKNPIIQIVGITLNNKWRILYFIISSSLAFVLYHRLGYNIVSLPIVPVSILGGALAIFLGFRNSSTYDRWWEARKIWGEIVNNSRSFTMQILTYSSLRNEKSVKNEQELKRWQKEMVYRHIGWVYAVKSHLRKEDYCVELKDWITEADRELLKNKTNIPAQLLNIQGQQIKSALHKQWIEDFRQYELIKTISRFYDSQGKCERIKNTIFPFYYNYFTRVFLGLFTLCLPFSLLSSMEWMLIPMSVSISFVFTILEKTGIMTEEPFEGRAADTPMKSICRTIEIDLREMIDDRDIPAPLESSRTKFGVSYME